MADAFKADYFNMPVHVSAPKHENLCFHKALVKMGVVEKDEN